MHAFRIPGELAARVAARRGFPGDALTPAECETGLAAGAQRQVAIFSGV